MKKATGKPSGVLSNRHLWGHTSATKVLRAWCVSYLSEEDGVEGLLEEGDGHVRLSPVARAVDLVRLPEGAVRRVLLQQPHLHQSPHNCE